MYLYLTVTTAHSYSTQDASAAMRVAENNAEIEELKRRNNDLQQAQSSLQYDYGQLREEYKQLLEENRNQVIKSAYTRSCDILRSTQ